MAKIKETTESKRQRAAEKVVDAADVGVDPHVAVATDESLVSDRTPEQFKSENESERETNELVAEAFQSRQFSTEVQERSNRAGNLIDKAFTGMEIIMDRYSKERTENPDISDKEAKVKDSSFLKATGMLMTFHTQTQATLVRQQIGRSKSKNGGLSLENLSDDELHSLMEPEGS